jgi:hypothetical protein
MAKRMDLRDPWPFSFPLLTTDHGLQIRITYYYISHITYHMALHTEFMATSLISEDYIGNQESTSLRGPRGV